MNTYFSFNGWSESEVRVVHFAPILPVGPSAAPPVGPAAAPSTVPTTPDAAALARQQRADNIRKAQDNASKAVEKGMLKAGQTAATERMAAAGANRPAIVAQLNVDFKYLNFKEDPDPANPKGILVENKNAANAPTITPRIEALKRALPSAKNQISLLENNPAQRVILEKLASFLDPSGDGHVDAKHVDSFNKVLVLVNNLTKRQGIDRGLVIKALGDAANNVTNDNDEAHKAVKIFMNNGGDVASVHVYVEINSAIGEIDANAEPAAPNAGPAGAPDDPIAAKASIEATRYGTPDRQILVGNAMRAGLFVTELEDGTVKVEKNAQGSSSWNKMWGTVVALMGQIDKLFGKKNAPPNAANNGNTPPNTPPNSAPKGPTALETEVASKGVAALNRDYTGQKNVVTAALDGVAGGPVGERKELEIAKQSLATKEGELAQKEIALQALPAGDAGRTTIQTEINTLTTDVATLKDAVKQKEAGVKTHEAELKKLNDKINELKALETSAVDRAKELTKTIKDQLNEVFVPPYNSDPNSITLRSILGGQSLQEDNKLQMEFLMGLVPGASDDLMKLGKDCGVEPDDAMQIDGNVIKSPDAFKAGLAKIVDAIKNNDKSADIQEAKLKDKGAPLPEATNAAKINTTYGLKLDFNNGVWSLPDATDEASATQLATAFQKECAAAQPNIQNVLVSAVEKGLSTIDSDVAKAILKVDYAGLSNPNQLIDQTIQLKNELPILTLIVDKTGDITFNLTPEAQAAIKNSTVRKTNGVLHPDIEAHI